MACKWSRISVLFGCWICLFVWVFRAQETGKTFFYKLKIIFLLSQMEIYARLVLFYAIIIHL